MAQEKKENSKFQQKIDHICRVVFLTEEGKPKSTVLLYSFCLSFVFLAVYLASYIFLIDVIENGLIAYSTGLRNVAEILIPAIAGSIPCVCLAFAFRERKGLVCAAYTWLAVYFLLFAVAGIFYSDWSDGGLEYRLLMTVFGLPSLSVLLCGGGTSYWIYRKRNRK